MKQKINIAEILKDCPKSMKLYTTVWGEVELIKICDVDMITILPTSNPYNTSNTKLLYSDGRFTLDGECILFPSKENRDWSTFQRPFKDGDILSYQCKGFKNRTIYIYMHHNRMNTTYYVALSGDSDSEFMINYKEGCALNSYNDTVRFAIEEEKQKLFDAIKANGYKWNPETKTLEKLPKFKVGDIVRSIISSGCYTIVDIKNDRYFIKSDISGNHYQVYFENESNYELVSNKFDINTLNPFDKVLVRGNDGQKWTIDFFGFMDKDKGFPFCMCGYYLSQCIPYEQNKHLLGTTNDCDEYYKVWEK